MIKGGVSHAPLRGINIRGNKATKVIIKNTVVWCSGWKKWPFAGKRELHELQNGGYYIHVFILEPREII